MYVLLQYGNFYITMLNFRCLQQQSTGVILLGSVGVPSKKSFGPKVHLSCSTGSGADSRQLEHTRMVWYHLAICTVHYRLAMVVIAVEYILAVIGPLPSNPSNRLACLSANSHGPLGGSAQGTFQFIVSYYDFIGTKEREPILTNTLIKSTQTKTLISIIHLT